ncbi:phosphatase PAP2 family protein [Nostoc sp. UHCC 0302]|uniref:phosphatase PAP2 family protein n=1 Tax=Nostoc sp. UHCC 0302 TaxID=3134896 RepID=UPI00311C9189
MNNYLNTIDNPWIQAIHTTIKGRARYKVSGLLHSEALKKYLELRLSQEEIIARATANQFTGNVLVIFHEDFTFKDIGFLLRDIVLDYTKKTSKVFVNKAHISTAGKKAKILATNEVGSQFLSNLSNYLSFQNLRVSLNKYSTKRNIIIVSGAVGTLVVVTALLHRYGVDQGILLAIQKLHTPLFDRIMLGVTSLADPLTLLVICLGLEINWEYYNHHWEATTLSLATAGAIGLNYLLKVIFGRARPALWNHIIDVGQHSFPSGHAMVSIVIYGFIAYILTQQFPQWKKQISALTVILIIAVGFSRLYLGVHWPTDILAGYAIGLVWLIFCIFILKAVQKSDLLDRASLVDKKLALI